MRISVAHQFLPKQPTTRAVQVMDHFGLGLEQGECVIADDLELPITSGDVVLFTGASGSGKSSLMRAVAARLADETTIETDDSKETAPVVVHLDDLLLPDRLLIDSVGGSAEAAMRLLSTCGLGEAQLMLRTPAELSDGQRYRFRLALALSQQPRWIVADEFTATLDRTLAKVIAFNIRRLSDRTGTGFLLATTHSDVAEDLAPDVTVVCRLDGGLEVRLPPANSGELPGTTDLGAETVTSTDGTVSSTRRCKKKEPTSPSPPTCGSRPRPAPTGRTSLGGIIAAITWASPGG